MTQFILTDAERTICRKMLARYRHPRADHAQLELVAHLAVWQARTSHAATLPQIASIVRNHVVAELRHQCGDQRNHAGKLRSETLRESDLDTLSGWPIPRTNPALDHALAVRAALCALKPLHQRVAWLLADGFTYVEAARIIGCSPSYIQKIRQSIQQALADVVTLH